MAYRLLKRSAGWVAGAALVIATSSPAAASCNQVGELLSQGLSIAQVADVLGAPVGAVQACLQPRPGQAAGGRVVGRAAPAPISAAGPPPLGAAGPPPLGAAGPPPLGAAGPPPLGAAGPPPLNSSGGSTTQRNNATR
jgi:hypothetical protein